MVRTRGILSEPYQKVEQPGTIHQDHGRFLYRYHPGFNPGETGNGSGLPGYYLDPSVNNDAISTRLTSWQSVIVSPLTRHIF